MAGLWVPDQKLFQPELLWPGRKPVGRAQADIADPYLLGDWMLSEGAGAIAHDAGPNRRDMQLRGATEWRVDPKIGRGAYISGAGGDLHAPAAVVVQYASDFSMALRLRITGWGSGVNPGLMRSGAASNGHTMIIFQGYTGLPWVRVGYIDVLKPDAGYAVQIGQCVDIVCVVRSGEWVGWYVDGVLRHQADHTVTTEPFDIYNVGWQWSAGERTIGHYGAIRVVGRALNADEVRALHAEPYRAIKPGHSPANISLAAGGATVSSDLDLRWDMLAAVTRDADLKWHILNAVDSDLQAAWDLLNSATNDVQLAWDTFNALTAELDTRWSILESIGQNVDLRWDIQSALTSVSSDLDLRWDMLAAVTQDADLKWQILNAVDSDMQLAWDLLNSATSDVQLAWDVLSSLTAVSADLDTRWDIRQAIAATLDTRWDILQAVGADASLKWDIANAVVAELNTQWDLLNSVSADVDLRWDSLEATESSITFHWSIDGLAMTPIVVMAIPAEQRIIPVPAENRVIPVRTH